MRAKKTYATSDPDARSAKPQLTLGRTDTSKSGHFMLPRAFDISFAGDVDVSNSAPPATCPL